VKPYFAQQTCLETNVAAVMGCDAAKYFCSLKRRYMSPAIPAASGPMAGRPPVSRTTTTSLRGRRH